MQADEREPTVALVPGAVRAKDAPGTAPTIRQNEDAARAPRPHAAPTVCVINGGIDDTTAINRINKLVVETALDSGWQVTAICRRLDPALRDRVEWIIPWVPPRLHLAQWLGARPVTKRVLATRSFDAVMTSQPQLADVADIFHCHFLSEAAREHNGFARSTTFRSWVLRVEQEIIARVEGRWFRRWATTLDIVFVSPLIEHEFVRRYGAPGSARVISNPGPPLGRAMPTRAEARSSLGLPADDERAVVGYLGGFDDRKGFGDVAAAARALPDRTFLIAGPDFHASRADLPSNMVLLGHIADPTPLLIASDVVLVPSRFDPYSLVVLEAASAGRPVVVTPTVGAAPDVELHGAGIVCRDAAFDRAIEAVLADPARYAKGATKLAHATAPEDFSRAVLEVLDERRPPRQAAG